MESTVVVEPTAAHTHTVIFLHGRGSNAREFKRQFFYSCPPWLDKKPLPARLPSIRWILPTATPRYSPVFKGVLHEWFDIRSLSFPEHEKQVQIEGLKESCSRVLVLIEEELKTLPANKIFLGGISQGCATAIHALLGFNEPLAGFFGVAGWLPFVTDIKEISKKPVEHRVQAFSSFYEDHFQCFDGLVSSEPLTSERSLHSLKTPVFLCHGTDDNVVNCKLGQELRDALSDLDMSVIWREDDFCGHWIKMPDAVDDLEHFLRRRIEGHTS